jgi:DNA-directed RNA polymerase beta subunit/intein/homing endonuclease
MDDSGLYRDLLALFFKQHDNRQIVYHQLASFNHFMNVEVPQTILRSCPVRVTGSPDLNLTGTTRAAAGTAGTAIRVSVEGAEDGAPVNTTKPGGPLLQAAAPEAGAPPPREVEVMVEFSNVQIRKPTIFENNGAVTPMYPNDARLRNLTYAAPVYTDIIATYTLRTPTAAGPPTVTVSQRTLPHVQVGRIPVMVGSDYCLLRDTPEKTPRELGECAEDVGGYFIVQGGERVIISQERMSENVPFVFRNTKVRNKEVEVIEIKSIGPDNEGAPKSMAVKLVQHPKNPTAPEHIVVTCPRIKAEIPLFIMMRALGVESDKAIIELLCGTVDTPYSMIFQECIANAADVLTQEKAHEWLAANLGSGGGSRESYSASTLHGSKPPRTTTVREVLAEECLPHVGGSSMLYEKAMFIGYMAKKALDVFTGRVPHDDRDAYPNKKVELPGNLMGNLFRYLFGTKVIKDMKTSLTKEIHNGFWKTSGKVEDIINPSNIYKILKSTIVTIGMKSSLATGNFVGGKMGTKTGISQVMNRLTYLSGISHLRRLSTPIEKTGKLLQPRKLHATQFGFICPCETPEGHAVGVVKNLSSTATVTLPMSPEPIVDFLYNVLHMQNLPDVPVTEMGAWTRVFINGAWIGLLEDKGAVDRLRAAKRSGRINLFTGITYKPARRELWINTEGGRLIRPVLNAAAARELVRDPTALASLKEIPSWDVLLRWISPQGNSLIEYIDPSETENFYIAMTAGDLTAEHTHMEIHPSTMLGTMGSNIPFPDHNQAPRNAYQCLSVDETVRMADGTERRIADVKVGDNVQVFDPKTLEMTTARVCHQYVRETDKRIYTIQAAGGRTITATEDHRFMTNQGWAEVKDLCPGQHMLAVSTEPEPLGPEDLPVSMILTRETFLTAAAAAGIHESLREAHADAMEASGLLPLRSNDPRLPLLARICGLVFTDGSLGVFNKSKTVAGKTYEYSLPQFQAHFGSAEAAERLEADVTALSMPLVSVRESHRTFNGATHHTWFVQHNGPLPSLLIALGAQTGKKTEMARVPVPEWIRTGSHHVKREFLSAFQGGDGCKFRANIVGDAVAIACNTTSQQTTPALAPALRAFMEQIVALYAEFGVDAHMLPDKTMTSDRTEVRYIFQASRANLLRFWQHIGFRYDMHKQQESAILAELIRDLGPETVIRPTDLERWLSVCYAQGSAVFIPIKKITEAPNCMISDITVFHDHHSFITSHGILSSNCAMGKQAMGIYSLNHRERMDTMTNLLWYSSVPLASPYMSQFYRVQKMPAGFNVVVAIMTYGGYNQEDSIMINRASLDRGLFRSEFYRTYKDEEKKNQASGEEERFCRPNPTTTRHMKLANYSKLGPDGLVPENTYVDQDDVLIGKVAPIRLRGADGAAMAGISHASLQAMSSVAAAQAVEAAGGKRFRDASKLMRTNEKGYVDRIYRGRNGEGYSFVKIRVREERRPEIGDKFASRHGQKGTCGLILEPEDMPRTADGIVPDIIINPHCFVGETQVALPNGLSRRIDSFSPEGMEKVWSWDPATERVYESYSLGMEPRGTKPTVRLTLDDGRTIRCTPDHKFKVRGSDGAPVWKEAGVLEFHDRLIMGPRGTEDIVCPMENSWSLDVGKYAFETQSVAGREKAMAFARILGYLHTDGCLCYSEASQGYRAVLYMGCVMDAHSIMDDILSVTGKTPKIQDCTSSTNGSKTYTIHMPQEFARSIAMLNGITIGRRTTQPASYPTFLFEEACPLSIQREFLAGCFGGDGWAPYLNGNRFSTVGFSQSIVSEFAETLEDRMDKLIGLMARVGVDAHVVRTRVCHMKTESYQAHPRVSVELHVDSNAVFREKIGFRHCIEKTLRLEAAAAYEGYCNEVRRQHNQSMAAVNLSMQEVKSYPAALAAVKALYTTEKPLNEYYSHLTPTLIGNRRKPGRATDLGVFDYKFMESASEWAKKNGCAHWFDKKSYIVDRAAVEIPTYNMGLMKREAAAEAPVYDIGVARTHMFMSEGSAVSNCIPSRMTIAHVMETLLGRLGTEAGFMGDASPFNRNMTVERIGEELKARGIEPSSNEILYCGYTGKQMPTSIFVGPIYYQRLKHMVSDKLHSRGTGPLVMLTRQPAEGRARDGGLRFGEMERDVLIAHGASTFLKERMMEASDNFEVHVCKGCGLIAVANKARNIWNCTGCGNTTDFSQVRIPYAYKLFLQELESMNISSRILPESRLRVLADAAER